MNQDSNQRSGLSSRKARSKNPSGSLYIVALIFLGILVPPLVTLIMTLYSSKTTETTSQYIKYYQVLLPPLLVFIVGILIIWRVYAFAQAYFIKLYQPPANIPIFKLFSTRLFGLPSITSPTTVSSSRFLVVQNGKLRNENDPVTWLGGPKLLVVLDGNALYLERGNQFSRVIGPGISKLEKYEVVREVVDLRPQQYCPTGIQGDQNNISAWTKDGVLVQCKVTITCRIGEKTDGLETTDIQYNPDGDLEELLAHMQTPMFPCDHYKVRQAVEWTKVRRKLVDGKEILSEYKWLDCAWGKVQGAMASYIAKQRLDDLFIATEKQNKKHTFSALQREEIQTKLNSELIKEAGISLLDLQISNLSVPEEIYQKNVEVWETKQKRWQKIKQAKIEAEKKKNIAVKKAAAQRDQIKEIAEELHRASQKGVEAKTLLMALSKDIHQGLQSPVFQQYLQQELAQQLREILNRS